MIGVIAKEEQAHIVEEFFQLFKVPWEKVQEGKCYDVLVVTDYTKIMPQAKLLLIFDPEPHPEDSRSGISLDVPSTGALLNIGTRIVPLYSLVSTVHTSFEPILVDENENPVAVRFKLGEGTVLRVGYDLFQEVQALLEEGQPAEHALIPTLDIHIELLRSWILDSDIPLVEVPPIPWGHGFTVCLTHDVDFLGIRHHGFGRTMLGFLFRVFSPSFYKGNESWISWRKLSRNLKALASLPFVFFRLVPDFWDNLHSYLTLEKDKGSTFYFIPYPNHAGEQEPANGTSPPRWRAARYDLRKYKERLKEIVGSGQEVGLHGIDAWADADKGTSERKIIEELTGSKCLGVRIHWLYFNSESPRVLESCGFKYDSTVGYNDAVGFKSGTGQVYKLPGTIELMELPMIIQDSAMFYRGRLNLDEKKAYSMCEEVLGEIKNFGGVLNINWHQRSLSPERNWDSFYLRFLEKLENYTPWFATASEAVEWFRSRRSVRFQEVSYDSDKVTVQVYGESAPGLPPLCMRVHLPDKKDASGSHHDVSKLQIFEQPLSGDAVLEFLPQSAEL
jgi:hypothetical protein